MPRLHPEIQRALDATGLEYSLEAGTRHTHIRLAGRLVGIVGRSPNNFDRSIKNIRAQIRRAAKEMIT